MWKTTLVVAYAAAFSAAQIDGPSATEPVANPVEDGTSAGPTLLPDWYWIRAVAAPNFHKYLQSKPTGVASPAYLDDAANAGQFNIIDGQLVYNTGEGGELYMHVENPDDKTQRTLETWFDDVPSEYGEFGWQGDTLTWHVDDIQRQNEAAWLVCGEQELFVNTGAYAYETPEGCADQTVSDASSYRWVQK